MGTVEGVTDAGGEQAPEGVPRVALMRSRFAALWWLRSYLKPWSRQVAVMFVAALVGVAASTLVPLVIEAIVDGPIKRGERSQLLPLFLAVLGLGIAEAGLIAYRRWLQSIAVLSVECPRLSRISTSGAKITRFSTALVWAK